MKERRKSYDLIFLMPILYALAAYGVAKLVENHGMYISGMDRLCHLYKGNAVYQAICDGDIWPMFDPLWYNGVETLRHWAPLPAYLLAACQGVAGGDPIAGFTVVVFLIFFAGAVSWYYVGCRGKRRYLGAFLGILWFFMPNNLYMLFYKGDLPRAIATAVLPMLMYWIYEYLQEKHWKTLPKISLCFAFLALCHSGYAGMILTAFLIYGVVDGVIQRNWKMCVNVLAALLLGYMLIGVWFVPSLIGGGILTGSSKDQSVFFQSMFLSLNPFARFNKEYVDVYFGLTPFFLAVFGIFLSKKKSMPGFWTGMILLLCTSNLCGWLLMKLSGELFLGMFHLISIALCMILFSFFIWDTLKKGWVLLFAGLLVLDVLPSLTLLLGNPSEKTPYEVLEEYSDWTLIGRAKEKTWQRLAFLDERAMDAMSVYLMTGYGKPVATTSGAAWQPTTMTENLKQLDRSLEEGNYLYLFDRCLELGNDTVVVRLDLVEHLAQSPIERMDWAAERVGYRLEDYNDDYRFYKLDRKDHWGTISKYRAIGIGTGAAGISRQFPAVEETGVTNLNDFTYEDLCEYDVIYLDGFVYENKSSAEQLVTKLSESGVRIVIAADGIPIDRNSQNQSFLGVVCNPVSFSQGYPDLNTMDGVLETDLFPDGFREWNTVYVNGLDDVWGTVDDLEWDLPFYGTVKNENIVVYGLNLTYYLSLTQDEGVAALLGSAMNLSSQELPKREIAPYTIQYAKDEIVIDVDREDVNSGLAYHDSFLSDSKIKQKNNLMYVKKGRTRILLTYPYLKQGVGVSLLGLFLLVWYVLYMRRKQQKSNKETE